MRPPALAVVGWSGSGKTTLLARLVPELRQRGLRVGVVKHSSDAHPLHREGSDTGRYREAGAAFVGFANPAGVQLSFPEPPDAVLPLLARFADTVDRVLVEGWKHGPLPKLEVWREELGPLLAASRQDVLAVVTESPVPEGMRRFAPDAVQGIAAFIEQCLRDGVLRERERE
jgi:molybdopterin-guanine dinucleotide biosynthesis adapter protein